MNVLFPAESNTILTTKTFNVGQDWEVPIEGFFIIGANEKRRSVGDFTVEEMHELGRVLRKVRLAMTEVLGIKDVYIFQNEDTEHGFHVWLFPRHEWMEPFGRKIESVRPIMLDAIANRSQEPHITQVNEATQKVRIFLQQS